MGCEQSTPVATKEDAAAQRYKDNLTGIGQTERQLSRMQREAMNGNSGAPDPYRKTPNAAALPQLDEQGFLTPEEVAKRTFSSISNKEVALGTISNVTHVQFAHWTQRGYYPDDPHKQNQDEFGTHLQFAGVDRDAMFAVYDGHGKQGHACAQFAQERLPKSIAKHVRRVRCQKYQKSRAHTEGKKGGWDPSRWPMLNRKEYETCCRKAFLEVNQAMHDEPTVSDNMSGTTAVTVNFHGSFVSISNVGDSRVVLGHRVRSNPDNTISVHCRMPDLASSKPGTGEEEKNDIDDEIVSYKSGRSAVAQPVIPPGSSFDTRKVPLPGTRVLAIPLSKDQTPYRKDERERVKASGAVIMSIDQMQGKEEMHEDWGDMVLGDTLDIEGDSPRLWIKRKDYPGCAFTRSLGDSLSEAIGVTAEPEILSTELTENDEYLVIASDGIFEFLTNQNVMDLCVASESPLMACEMIVKASYQQWLTYENRTDDITVIVCFLQNFKLPKMDGNKGTTEDLVETMASIYGERAANMLPPMSGGYAFSQLPSFRNDDHDRSSTCSRSIASIEGIASIQELEEMEEEEAAAYLTEEAQAVVVRNTTPPPAPMVFDNNADSYDVKIDSFMEEVNAMDNTTSKTVSVTSGDDDDHIDHISIIDEEEDGHKGPTPATGTPGLSPDAAERDAIQI